MLITECLCFQGTPALFFFSSGGEKRKFLVIYPGTKTTHKHAKSDQNKTLNHLEENQESFYDY